MAKTCGQIKDDGTECKARIKKEDERCVWHREPDTPTITERRKEAERALSGDSSTLTKHEAEQILTQIARGEMTEKKTTATGEIFDQPPTARDRKDAVMALAKLNQWDEARTQDGDSLRVTVYLPRRRGG